MRPPSKSRFAFFLGLGLALVALGCKREPAPEAVQPDEDNGVKEVGGAFITAQTPDGHPLVVTFPGKPEWTDIPNTFIPAKGFVWPGDDKHGPHAAWVWTIPPEERFHQTDAEIAAWYGRAAAELQPTAGLEIWSIHDGIRIGGWDNKPRDPQGWHDPNVNLKRPPRNRPIGGQIPAQKGTCAGAAIVVGNKVYGIRVTRPDATFEDPDFKALLASLQVPEFKNRPPRAKAPDDDLRPLAYVKLFSPLTLNPSPGGAGICSSRGAALFAVNKLETQFNRSFTTSHLMRYAYPSFKPDGEYQLPKAPYLFVVDDKRSRLYLATGAHRYQGGAPDNNTELARFDVPERLGEGKVEDASEWKSAKFTGRIEQLHVAPDGRSVYALHTTAGDKVEVVRVGTDGMTVTGTLPIAVGSRSLCMAPDGRTLYAAVDGGGIENSNRRKCMIQEIDAETLKVRRTFMVCGAPYGVVCGPDGCLYYPGPGLMRTDPTVPGNPASQIIEDNSISIRFHFSPDGKRLYRLGHQRRPYSLDVREAVAYGRLVIAPKGMHDYFAQFHGDVLTAGGERQYYSENGSISSDGKCLFLETGHAFWLTGAGPLPEVDPRVKWQP